ncbi:type IV pilus modification protein PilV [Acinetobacter cumulans]|uniref:Type IV pilus modification protein PilV n=1 Tax=Acinetobacter cumulans TaxID=2136182 RepID=A0ABX9U811_9GAMM|nr:type IV pilus modification protein PilV [Acinetobacter cumulans]RLL48594.1 type IV pilus modification protein PilV [Acinetobacter cumulans]
MKIVGQQGVGLVEVLVALILLAIGVLGYTALQVRAVEASTEATQRSHALFVLRGLTESIRANNAGRNEYAALVNRAVPDSITVSCINPESAECSAAGLAENDVLQAQANARNFGMHLRMESCPGTAALPDASTRRSCLYAAWGETDIRANSSACMSNAGVYVVGASCIMLEAY